MDENAKKAKQRPVDRLGTRELLITTALRLFAERGVFGVSLRAVGEAAAQRNTAAVHYHFGDRDTLLSAALDRVLAAIREPVEYEDARRLGLVIRPPATPLHHAVGRAFLPLMTLPLRHPDWGEAGARLLARVLLGEVAALARELEAKSVGDTDVLISELSPLLPHIPLPLLRSRLDFATVNVVCGLTATTYLNAIAPTEHEISPTNELAGLLLEYIAAGLAAPTA